MLERREERANIASPVNMGLYRCVIDNQRRLRIGERATDKIAQDAKVNAERSFAVLLGREEIPHYGHLITFDVGKQQSRTAIEPFHDGGDLEMRVYFRGEVAQPACFGEASQSRAKTRVDDPNIDARPGSVYAIHCRLQFMGICSLLYA